MTKASPQAVSIAPGHNKPALSPGQKTFQSLIRQIEKRRQRLRDWETTTSIFQQRYVDEVLPLDRESSALLGKLVRRLDEASQQNGLTKTELRTISELITGMAGELLEEGDDSELKAIYDRHSPSDYDSEAAADAGEMKAMFEAMLGVDLGDDIDLSSSDEVMRRAHASMEEQWAREQAEYQAGQQAREARRAGRKPTAKQAAAQARKEAEQAALGQSIREVYRKLASALHPDREPDPEERARKTALMQRVNQAYGRNDLLQLLELQLELEHIDQHAIDNIAEDRLKHYNKILREQVRELDQEIQHVEFSFREAYGISPFVEVSPDTALRLMEHDIAGLRQEIRDLEADLIVFDDRKTLKGWLKRQKHQQSAIDFDGMPF